MKNVKFVTRAQSGVKYDRILTFIGFFLNLVINAEIHFLKTVTPVGLNSWTQTVRFKVNIFLLMWFKEHSARVWSWYRVLWSPNLVTFLKIVTVMAFTDNCFAACDGFNFVLQIWVYEVSEGKLIFFLLKLCNLKVCIF